MGRVNYSYKVKKYFRFSGKELYQVGGLSVLLAFILTFNDWGTRAFEFGSGIQHLIIGIIVVLISMLAHFSIKKLIALALDLRITHKLAGYKWLHYSWFTLLIPLASNGLWPVYLTSSYDAEVIGKTRIGKSSAGGVNLKHLAWISFAGLATTTVIAGLAWWAFHATGWYGFDKAITFNALYIIYNLLPLPSLDGANLFFSSRMLYVFTAVALVSFTLLVVFGLPSFIISAAIGLIALILFYTYYERKL